MKIVVLNVDLLIIKMEAEIIPNYEKRLKELQRKALRKPSTIILFILLLFSIGMLIRSLILSI